jgi:hypothetical protein
LRKEAMLNKGQIKIGSYIAQRCPTPLYYVFSDFHSTVVNLLGFLYAALNLKYIPKSKTVFHHQVDAGDATAYDLLGFGHAG